MQSIAVSVYTSTLFELTQLFWNTLDEKWFNHTGVLSPKVVANVLKGSPESSMVPNQVFGLKVAQLAPIPNLATLLTTGGKDAEVTYRSTLFHLQREMPGH